MDYSRHVPEDFSGVVSVQRKGEALWRRAYGYADLPNGRPNLENTRFGVASGAKAFTAVGIMTLIRDGKLVLGTALGEVFPEGRGKSDPAVTIAQLLTHTSGIYDYCDEAVVEDYADLWRDFPNYRIRCNADLLPLFRDHGMLEKPGEKFRYNNSGFVLLGLVMEKISGLAMEAYLRRAVFAPLGMADTAYPALDRLLANCANAYILDKKTGEYYTNIYSIDAKGGGAGGVFTTAADVESLWRGLYAGELLPLAMVRDMHTRHAGGRYGYGFWIREDGNPSFQGGDPGVGFVTSYDLATQTTVTAISNFEKDVWKIQDDIMKK